MKAGRRFILSFLRGLVSSDAVCSWQMFLPIVSRFAVVPVDRTGHASRGAGVR
jgi:hypothetical protein